MKEKIHEPFLLSPAAKDYLWGGNRLNEQFGKNIDMSPLAETWECSAHPDGQSVVRTGEFAGLGLGALLREHPGMLGSKYEKTGELPVLIKFIDAKKDLSVQVHPSDEYAEKYENGQNGKTEMWYVVDADENSQLVCGLTERIGAAEFRAKAENGTLEDCLNRVSVKKGDSFFITPGTVHAIGAGLLIAEIQENSNLTYRIYDYNRTDRNGNKRPLHLDRALDVAVLEPYVPAGRNGGSGVICSCDYFTVDRIDLTGGDFRICVDGSSFQVLLCIGGEGDADGLHFSKGDCMFIPAGDRTVVISGNAAILRTVC